MKILKDILATTVEINEDLILKLISFIDLTSLNDSDHPAIVKELCELANKGFKQTHPAAVCVYANFGDLASSLVNPPIHTAVVSSCFPSSQTLPSVKIFEAQEIAKTKVNEVDIVINRGDALSGRFDKIENEIKAIKSVLGDKHLKVILESGELESEFLIRTLSKLAIHSGANFIKTSTGKSKTGATAEAAYYMCTEIQSHFKATGQKIGFKPSGGIRTLKDALVYYKIVNETLGEDWLTADLFRIGASSLYKNLIDSYKAL